MNRRIIAALYKKEILDILRDKKTILMMIVVPLILYPLIFVGSLALMSSVMNADKAKPYTISFGVSDSGEELGKYFKDNEKEYDYSFIIEKGFTDAQDEEKLNSGELDAFVHETVSENRPYYEIGYRASDNDSQTAAEMVRRLLSDYRNDKSVSAVEEEGLDPDVILEPIGFTFKDYSSNEENVGFIMGYIIPFLLIVSILMGAMYPAIDTTAGEKERGTLETMLTLPVTGTELITAKFLAVSTIAVGAAILNLLSMSFITAYTVSTAGMVDGNRMDFNVVSFIPTFLITMLCVLVFAMFASAVCMCACIMAKSFKEAQNLTSPVMIVFMICSMAGMIPQMKLDKVTSLIPVVNISLLITDIFSFNFDFSLIAAVLFSNIAYSALTIVIMTRIFNSEDLLFAEAGHSIRIIEKRSDMKKGQTPGIGDLVLLFSVLLLIVLFVSSAAVLKLGIWGLAVEQFLILAVTVFYAWYIKTDMKALFHIKKPKVVGVPGAVISWVGALLIAVVVSDILIKLFPGMNTDTGLGELWDGKAFWVVVVNVALMPAICEEAAFRGFMLGTLEKKMRPMAAVIITGIIFGAYHMSIMQLILVGALGILNSYVTQKTGCIFLSVLMHFLNNFSSVAVSIYPEKVEGVLPFLVEESLDIKTMVILVAAGIVLLCLGILMINKSAGRDKSVAVSA